ncbi:putative permease [Abditibacterium utsteinense]|uniref:Putative permease n=1 Tax=Abditibacterium utsteinense TaxID=1960156 RepID=A0A2S8SX92_9BACT|nr:AEC family transporter [Abditibacterium utsteinense]PQV65417.1 putative permease [Abditibacterium utsteinense]
MLSSDLVSPAFVAAFLTAATATSKVFAVGAIGFYAVWRRWISDEGLSGMSALVAFVTLPCLIFTRFATQFDARTFPGWWKIALLGTALQIAALALGTLVANRHKNPETTMLIGFQNAGFFVLPMLQALLAPAEFNRAALMLFVFILFFNAFLWIVGNWVLLGKRELDWKRILFSPPLFATLISLGFFGFFHDFGHGFESSTLWQILLGGKSPGALQLVGDLTVPLATLILGGAIAGTLNAKSGLEGKRQSLEIAAWKLFFVPLCGWFLLRVFRVEDHSLRLLLMLECAAPPAINVAVFCQQHSFPMRLTPTACLLCYAVCIVSVPFWVALVL